MSAGAVSSLSVQMPENTMEHSFPSSNKTHKHSHLPFEEMAFLCQNDVVNDALAGFNVIDPRVKEALKKADKCSMFVGNRSAHRYQNEPATCSRNVRHSYRLRYALAIGWTSPTPPLSVDEL